MIIPVRCFTCGKTLGNLWNKYVERCEEADAGAAAAASASDGPAASGGAGRGRRRSQQHKTAMEMSSELGGGDGERPGEDGKTKRGRILDDLGVTSYCCRVIMLSHVDLTLVI